MNIQTFIGCLILSVIAISGCQTVIPAEPGDDGGPKPTELRKHVMEVLNPDFFTRPTWISEIGKVGEQTLMVMSEVETANLYLSIGFGARTYPGWKYCASLINPPAKAGEKARVGVLTIFVLKGVGRSGRNSCLWYEPTEQFKQDVAQAIRQVEN